MIYKGDGIFELEDGEPAMRSCWECNAAHERLKKVNILHHCFSCGRWWVFDNFIGGAEDESDETISARLDARMKHWGVAVGASTTTVDAGYRVTEFIITLEPEG